MRAPASCPSSVSSIKRTVLYAAERAPYARWCSGTERDRAVVFEISVLSVAASDIDDATPPPTTSVGCGCHGNVNHARTSGGAVGAAGVGSGFCGRRYIDVNDRPVFDSRRAVTAPSIARVPVTSIHRRRCSSPVEDRVRLNNRFVFVMEMRSSLNVRFP